MSLEVYIRRQGPLGPFEVKSALEFSLSTSRSTNRGYLKASIEAFSGTLESLQKSLNLRVSRTWNGYLQAIGLVTLSRLFIVIRSGYYRVFDSQNLSLKLGFWIHAFAGIDAFWGPERMLSEKNHPWEFRSFDSGPQKLQSTLSNTGVANRIRA